jgi:hypothetical protein
MVYSIAEVYALPAFVAFRSFLLGVFPFAAAS